ARAAVFTVTSANNNGGGTLRQAIANANGSAGADTIVFNILPAGTYTINLTSALPAITEAVTIDGTTQPGYVAGGPPRIELNGAGAGAVAGLHVAAGVSVTIKSLCINRFTTGIRLTGSSNTIQGSYIGTDPTGAIARANQVGIYVRSNLNQIDGTSTAGPNVISGNSSDGIQIDGGTGAGDNNVIQGNYIGVNAAGGAGLGNGSNGVSLLAAAANNTIGGTAASARNVISGNTVDGIRIFDVG